MESKETYLTKLGVQKWNEMNKELDYDDFFDSGNEEEGDEGEGGEAEEDDKEFLESENEDINSDEAVPTTPKNGAEKVAPPPVPSEKSDKGKENRHKREEIKYNKFRTLQQQ